MEQNRKEKIWALRDVTAEDTARVEALAKETGRSPVVARLLYARGYHDAAAVTKFLRFGDAMPHSPFLMKDMEAAVARIRRAVEAKEKIVIYGDYDVDGVTSVSLLYLYLKDLGADVGYYIPSRSGEGYGLSALAIDKLAQQGVTFIVTVDTGITAVAETEHARERGVEMVITDHHECRPELPAACAVLNPHRPDCDYPFKELAGVGVVYKLVCAYEATLGAGYGESEMDCVRRVSERFADLVAIGTIADVMPILDENRIIVAKGLSLIERRPRVGLAALMEEASGNRAGAHKKKKVTSSFIGFGIAPRLNAAGRMSEASRAVELLLAETQEEAAPLAAELCEINRQRQGEENRIAEQAYRRIDEDFDLSDTRVLVLDDDGWRQGIIGIVSSRITEHYGMPSILVSFDGATRGFDSPDDLGKGSGRSVKGMNLVAALNSCDDLLVKSGGHELAAGLTVRRGDLPEFRRRINEYAAKYLPAGGIRASLDADCELALSDVSMALAEELTLLEPYGVGNPVPQFILRDLAIERVSELGGGKHLKLLVSSGGVGLYAMCFSTSRSEFPYREGDRVDLLCTVDINEYQNVRSVQLIVQDYKASEAFGNDFAAQEARYREIRAGGTFDAEEGVIPEREDFAHVYTVLRREFRAGNDTFSERTLLSLVNVGAPRPVGYVCLKYILEIFRELQICGVEEEAGVYRFDIYFTSAKTNIEKSAILKHLKSLCRNRT